MVRYTRDKWGCLVFPAGTDFKGLALDNCFIAKGDKSIWVFPFNKLNKYIKEFQGFDDFLEGKGNFFIIKGQITKEQYHFCCLNKMNFITGGCQKYNCNYSPPPNLRFNWRKPLCRYVSPMYADIEHRACRSVMFTQLCPSKAVFNANKETLSSRGKRASITRKNNSVKCQECMFNDACDDKYNYAKRNCKVTRKMMNRTMRDYAIKRFGSWDIYFDLFRYANTRKTKENALPIIISPASATDFVVQNSNRAYERMPLAEVKKDYKRKPVSLALEEQAKAYLYLMSIIADDKNSIFNSTTLQNSWYAFENKRASYHYQKYVQEFTINNYQDIIKLHGKRGKEKVWNC